MQIINVPSSKSISNRVLLIQKIATSSFGIDNLSTAIDCEILKNILCQHTFENVNVHESGTAFRFLLAYFCFINNPVTIQGNGQINNRPILDLITSLSKNGARFSFLNKENYAPLNIEKGINHDATLFDIDLKVSSQFASALLLCAPLLHKKVSINLINRKASNSYILMTIKLMQIFGIEIVDNENQLIINTSKYILKQSTYFIENDWSAAVYVYAHYCLCNTSEPIFIPNLFKSGLQGDEMIIDWFTNYGIDTKLQYDGIVLSKSFKCAKEAKEFDFINNIDIAATFIVLDSLVQNFDNKYYNLDNLIYKESNRLQAIATNLKLINCDLLYNKKCNYWYLAKSKNINGNTIKSILTANDHRIAMSFDLLSYHYKIELDDIHCVEKSFPDYWVEMLKIKNLNQ